MPSIGRAKQHLSGIWGPNFPTLLHRVLVRWVIYKLVAGVIDKIMVQRGMVLINRAEEGLRVAGFGSGRRGTELVFNHAGVLNEHSVAFELIAHVRHYHGVHKGIWPAVEDKSREVSMEELFREVLLEVRERWLDSERMLFLATFWMLGRNGG